MTRICLFLPLLLFTACESPPGICGNALYDMRAPPPTDAGAADTSPDASVRPSFSPAGVTISEAACLSFQLSTGVGASSDARRAADLKKITEAGVTLLRGDFLWHHIEKVKGTFNFTGHDARLTASEKANVGHIALLAYGNPWATTLTTSDHKFPPDDPADFANFAAAVVKHYKGRIKIYEIWNEPNGGYRFWKSNPKGDPKAYGALLKAAYSAAKAADPAATVLFGGPFFNDQVIPGHINFLTQAYAAHSDLSQYFDGMAMHPYALYPPAAPPERADGWEAPIWQKVAAVRALMAKHGGGNKPLHVTEMGWPVWKSVSEAQQAAYLVRGFILLLAAGATNHCWYTLNDSVNSTTPTEGTFGLLSAPDSKGARRDKAAFTAHKTLTKTLGAYRLETDLAAAQALSPGVFAYRLKHKTSGARALVVWSTAAAAAPVTLPISAGVSQVKKVTLLGQESTVTASGGQVTVTPGAVPIYLVE